MRPTVLACVPSDAAAEEIEALRDALRNAGAARATVVPEPLAAAVGAGLDLSSPHAQMLVDVGEGVTDVAVIRNGLVEDTLAIRVGCSDLRATIMDRIACLSGVVPSEAAVEELVRRAAQRGRELGQPASIEFTLEPAHAGSRPGTASVEQATIAAAMEPVVEAIVEVVREAWRRLPARPPAR